LRRWTPIAVFSAVVVGAVLWWPRGEVSSEDELSVTPSAVPVQATARVPAAPSEVTAEDIDALAPKGPGDRALTRIASKEAELKARLQEAVDAERITEAEARKLHGVASATLADARSIAERVQSGEIHWMGGVLRSVPLRVTHVSRVVNAVGYERARELGDLRRESETQ